MISSTDIFGFLLSALACGSVLLLIAIYFQVFAFPFTKEGRKAAAENRELQERIEASRCIEIIEGKAWEVVTKPYTVIRNKKSGRYAAILERGIHNEACHDQNHQITMRPRWIRVQPLTKQLVLAQTKQHWTQTKNWVVTGTIDLHCKDRLAREPSKRNLKNA